MSPKFFKAFEIFAPAWSNRMILKSTNNESDKIISVRKLGQLKDKKAGKYIVAAFITRKKWGLTEACFKALQDIYGLENMADPFIEEFSESLSDNAKASIASALGYINNTKAIPILLEILKENKTFVKESAAKALGKIGDPIAIDPLINLLKNSQKNIMWNPVIESLSELAKYQNNKNDVDKIVDSLIEEYDKGERWFRYDTTIALGEIGNNKSLKKLHEIYNNDKDKIVKEGAIYFLKKKPNLEIITDLVDSIDFKYEIDNSRMKTKQEVLNNAKSEEERKRIFVEYMIERFKNRASMEELNILNKATSEEERDRIYLHLLIKRNRDKKMFEKEKIIGRYLVFDIIGKWKPL